MGEKKDTKPVAKENAARLVEVQCRPITRERGQRLHLTPAQMEEQGLRPGVNCRVIEQPPNDRETKR